MVLFIFVSVYGILSLNLFEAADVRNVIGGVTWSGAEMECGIKGLEYNLTVLQGLEQLYNNSFWLGVYEYQVKTPWMYPIGCYHTEQNQRKRSSKDSIGLCQQSCNLSQNFGYQGSLCQCIDSNDFTNMTKTSISNCRSNNDEAMMVYSVFNYTVSGETEKDCMISTCSFEGHITRHPQNCNTTTSSIVAVCDTESEGAWDKVYKDAKQECLMKNKLLLPPDQCSNKIGTYVWTSAFRELIPIEVVNEFKNRNTHPTLCLSGSRNLTEKGNIQLTKRSCKEVLYWFVCSSGLNKQNTSSPVFQDTRDHEQNHGTLIGAITAGLATILVVVALMLWVWWKRRNDKSTDAELSNKHQHTRQISHASNTQYGGSIPRNAVPNQNENTMIKSGNQQHMHSVAEYSTVNKHSKEATVDSVYVSAKEEEYDELNKISCRKIHQSPSNTYGFLGQCDEGEYDTTKGVSNGFTKSTEDIYDSNVPNCKGSSDNTYDTANINQFRSK